VQRMFQLSPVQFNQIQDARRDRIARDITEWLLEEFPDDGGTLESALPDVRRAANEAWGWGIESTELVRLHVYMCKVLGRGYQDAAPMIGEVLADRSLSDDLKLAWFAGWIDAFKRHNDEEKR